MPNSLDPNVGPDLGPNFLQRLSADDNSRQIIKSKLLIHVNEANTVSLAINVYTVCILYSLILTTCAFNFDTLLNSNAIIYIMILCGKYDGHTQNWARPNTKSSNTNQLNTIVDCLVCIAVKF